jgi:predicted transcriptional regulator
MDKRVVELLEDLKKLMILDLVSNDIKGKDIAAVLGVDPAVVSRLVSKRAKKKGKGP